MGQPRDNSGALFKNTRKTQQNHPDYRGDIMVAGVQYDLSAWLKQGTKGTFMSLAVTTKRDAPQQPTPPQNLEPQPEQDIPF